MRDDYTSGKISITAAAQEINPSFDIGEVSFSGDEEFLFRIKNKNGWGTWISVPSTVAFHDLMRGSRVQVKALSGTVTLYYFIRGV